MNFVIEYVTLVPMYITVTRSEGINPYNLFPKLQMPHERVIGNVEVRL